MTRKRSLLYGRILELTRGYLAASLLLCQLFHCQGYPYVLASNMKTMVTEVARGVWGRM